MKLNLFKKDFILATVISLSAIVLLSLVTANSRLETKAGQITIDDPSHAAAFMAASTGIAANETLSKEYTTSFPFNAISFSWEEKADIEFKMQVRFKENGWTEWVDVVEEVDFKDDAPKTKNISRIVFSPYTNTFQYKLTFAQPEQKQLLASMSVEYIDSTKGEAATLSAATVGSDGLNIISRAAWGADESYRFDATGSEVWPAEYYMPKKFVIHHTASSDVTDPAATVRAIYYWHAKSNGWGDIGYNYLVDAQGNIYEGRAGGDGVVGGHAYMNNRNSIGIAVLGCYHPDQKECNTPEQLTPQTKAALEKLIAVKSQVFNIDPVGQSNFNNHGHIHNVIGHRNVNSTNCPGDLIYSQLELVRGGSDIKLASLPQLKTYEAQAEFVSVSDTNVSIPEGETRRVTVRYKNTGQSTWRGYEDAGMILSTDAKRLGKIGSYRFATAGSGYVSGFTLKEGNVPPGGTGTFVLDLPARNATSTYTLAWNGKGYFPGTDVTITTTRIAAQTAAPNSPAPQVVPVYSALIERTSIPERIPANTNQAAEIRFYNIGNTTWSADQLTLRVSLENGATSPLLSTQTFRPIEQSIGPNEGATFQIPITAGSDETIYTHQIRLAHGTNEIMNFSQSVAVISPYSGVVVSENFPIAIKNTWRPTVQMTVRNVGSKAWVNPTLKSTDVDGTLSWFYDWSWAAKKTVGTEWTTVEPGQEVTFEFRIRPYWKPNTYPHVYKLWTGDQAITINGQDVYERLTRVDQ